MQKLKQSIFFIFRIFPPIKYDCLAAPLQFNGISYSFWNDRNGIPRYFWAGKYSNDDHICQCGIDRNCVNPDKTCNCDALELQQLSDNGT